MNPFKLHLAPDYNYNLECPCFNVAVQHVLGSNGCFISEDGGNIFVSGDGRGVYIWGSERLGGRATKTLMNSYMPSAFRFDCKIVPICNTLLYHSM